jgi:hypothetical protein
MLSSAANVSSGTKFYHLELMLSSGTKCYHLGWNVIMWDAMLSSGANVIIWDEVISSGANVIMLQSGANVIIWCYHVMLSSWMITPPFFIFPENFTHSCKTRVWTKHESNWRTTDLFVYNKWRIFGSKGLVDFRHLTYIDRFIALLAPQ